MELPRIDLEPLRAIPPAQKIAFLAILIGGIIGGFYNYIVVEKHQTIETLERAIAKLDAEEQTLVVKVKHLDQVIAATKQLELELEKKKEMLPQEEEAIMLLKQMSDLGTQLGLEIQLWKPGGRVMDGSKLFVRMPVNVTVAGGYHTAALFFDRIVNLPRIMNVTNLRMASPKVVGGNVHIQTTFVLTAYVSPPGK